MPTPRMLPRPFTPTAVLVLLALAVLRTAVVAQGTVSLAPGARLRINMAETQGSFVVTLVGVRRDTLVVGRSSAPAETALALAVSRMRKLEVSTGTRSLAALGTGGGLLLGAVLTGGYNGVVSSQCFRDCGDKSFPVFIGAGIGAVVGGLAFAFVRADRWREIALPGRGVTTP